MGDIATIILKRLGLGFITLLVISIIIFFAVELLPGDIAQAVLGQGATEENVAAMRKELGLDRAAPIRYFEWLGGALTGDFGRSLVSQTPVAEAIGTPHRIVHTRRQTPEEQSWSLEGRMQQHTSHSGRGRDGR